MKKKGTGIPWAALRRGFTGRDWAGAWLKQMAAYGLPGVDFLMAAPSTDYSSFKDSIANFYHAQAALRALLVLDGMPEVEAMSYSCHSWRHLYPTAGKQMGLTDGAVGEMGHWEAGSNMPRGYVSMACVSELLTKRAVCDAFSSGWDVTGPGCLPTPVPKTVHKQITPPLESKPVENKFMVPVVKDAVIPQARLVSHITQGRTHLWNSGV